MFLLFSRLHSLFFNYLGISQRVWFQMMLLGNMIESYTILNIILSRVTAIKASRGKFVNRLMSGGYSVLLASVKQNK